MRIVEWIELKFIKNSKIQWFASCFLSLDWSFSMFRFHFQHSMLHFQFWLFIIFIHMFFGPSMPKHWLLLLLFYLNAKVNNVWIDLNFYSFFSSSPNSFWFFFFSFFIIIYGFISSFSFQYGCLLPLERLQNVCIQIIDFFLILKSFVNSHIWQTLEVSLQCKKTNLVTVAWERYNVAKHESVSLILRQLQTVMYARWMVVVCFSCLIFFFFIFCWLIIICILITLGNEHWSQGNHDELWATTFNCILDEHQMFG